MTTQKLNNLPTHHLKTIRMRDITNEITQKIISSKPQELNDLTTHHHKLYFYAKMLLSFNS